MTSHTRRAVLATLTGVGLAGCTTFDNSDPPSEDEQTSSEDEQPPTEDDLPDDCNKALDLDVQWPRELDTDTVGEFVMDYEEVYLVEENAETQFHSPSFDVELDQTPDKLADGFHVRATYTGSVHIDDYLHIQAFEVEPDGIPKDNRIKLDESAVPDDPEHISIDEIEDQILQSVLKLAADSGYEDHKTAYETRYEELIEDLPPNASLNNRRMGAYFDVSGTPVLLVIDREGGASEDWGSPTPVQYYVTGYVIRRTEDENKSPQDGTVVECRLPESEL